VLNAKELARLRRQLSAEDAVVEYDKPTVNAALLATDAWFVSHFRNLFAAIDGVTTGFTFTPRQKRRIIAAYLRERIRDNP
jgi:hypothetical protein